MLRGFHPVCSQQISLSANLGSIANRRYFGTYPISGGATIAFGNGPAPAWPEGRFYCVLIEEATPEDPQKLAIGLTAAIPHVEEMESLTLANLPQPAFAVGFNGKILEGNKSYQGWSSKNLKTGDVLGILLSWHGEMAVYVNRDLVFSKRIGLHYSRQDMMPVIDLLDSQTVVALLPFEEPPPSARSFLRVDNIWFNPKYFSAAPVSWPELEYLRGLELKHEEEAEMICDEEGLTVLKMKGGDVSQAYQVCARIDHSSREPLSHLLEDLSLLPRWNSWVMDVEKTKVDPLSGCELLEFQTVTVEDQVETSLYWRRLHQFEDEHVGLIRPACKVGDLLLGWVLRTDPEHENSCHLFIHVVCSKETQPISIIHTWLSLLRKACNQHHLITSDSFVSPPASRSPSMLTLGHLQTPIAPQELDELVAMSSEPLTDIWTPLIESDTLDLHLSHPPEDKGIYVLRGHASLTNAHPDVVLDHLWEPHCLALWDGPGMRGFEVITDSPEYPNQVVYWLSPDADRDFLQWRLLSIDPSTGIAAIIMRPCSAVKASFKADEHIQRDRSFSFGCVVRRTSTGGTSLFFQAQFCPPRGSSWLSSLSPGYVKSVAQDSVRALKRSCGTHVAMGVKRRLGQSTDSLNLSLLKKWPIVGEELDALEDREKDALLEEFSWETVHEDDSLCIKLTHQDFSADGDQEPMKVGGGISSLFGAATEAHWDCRVYIDLQAAAETAVLYLFDSAGLKAWKDLGSGIEEVAVLRSSQSKDSTPGFSAQDMGHNALMWFRIESLAMGARARELLHWRLVRVRSKEGDILPASRMRSGWVYTWAQRPAEVQADGVGLVHPIDENLSIGVLVRRDLQKPANACRVFLQLRWITDSVLVKPLMPMIVRRALVGFVNGLREACRSDPQHIVLRRSLTKRVKGD